MLKIKAIICIAFLNDPDQILRKKQHYNNPNSICVQNLCSIYTIVSNVDINNQSNVLLGYK